MNPFNSSSGQRRTSNADGSYNVYCSVCHDFIAVTMLRIPRALCVICQAADEGRVLTPECIRDYKLSKGGRVDVSLLVLPEVMPGSKLKKFSMRTMVGDMLTAVGLKLTEGDKQKELESKKVSKEKRSRRVFDGVDIDTQLGSVTDFENRVKGDKK